MELILLGIVIPPGYFVLKVMFFTSPTPIEVTVVAAISILCIVLGVTAIWRNRRRRYPGE